MTIDKTAYQNILTEITATLASVQALQTASHAADSTDPYLTNFNTITTNVTNIESWAEEMINQADEEEVMADFLSEMKVVFDKYAAKIEIGSDTAGYGTAYGEGASAVGFKLTATLNGVTSSQEINKTVMASEDLV